MPGEQAVSKFMYFYGAYAPKANIHKFLQYSSKSNDLLQQPKDPIEVARQKYLEIG